MNVRLTAVSLLFIFLSCNTNDENNPSTVNTETTTTTDDDKTAVDTEAEKKALYKQSLACIALMNKLEEELNAAYAAGEAETARTIKTRIDSAATENAKIGQKLMALEK